MLKLYAIKDTEKNLYFQLERDVKTLKFADEIGNLIFKDYGYDFASTWQGGFPQYEDQESYKEGNLYFGVVIAKERVHFIIVGLEDVKKRNKVKDIVTSNFEWTK